MKHPLQLIKNNLSIIPIKDDGSKASIVKWEPFQQALPTKENIEKWSDHRGGWAIICGKVSGNLEVLDFDTKYKKDIWDLWYDLLSDTERDIIKTLPHCSTPSGGFHLWYRCAEIEKNQSRFCRGEVELNGKKESKAFIETRGEGGYALIPPSIGYKLLWGDFENIPEITKNLRTSFFAIARALNEEVTAEITPHIPSTSISAGDRPGDIFNARAPWSDILLPLGWKIVKKQGEKIFWRRPGKDWGISATENYNGNGLLHVFTSSTSLPEGKSYTKFSVYTHLNHSGDWNKSAAELKRLGYIKSEPALSPIIDTIEYPLILVRLSDVKMKPIDWLWEGKIAKGKVSLIAGSGGLGKSQVSLFIASIVSNGGEWPAQTGLADAGNVVILTSEDDASDTLVPRLVACGANMSRITKLVATKIIDKDGGIKKRHFDFGTDLKELDKTLKMIGNVALVIIDPISDYLGKVDSNNNSEVRGILSQLAEMATDHHTAFICITHLNKNTKGTDASSRIIGSSGFLTASRAAFLITKDQKTPHRRLMTVVKNNLAEDFAGLAFSIEPHNFLNEDNEGIKTSRVVWEAEQIGTTADDAVGGERKEAYSPAREEAIGWLYSLLKDQPMGMNGNDLKKLAKKEGLSIATLYRAIQPDKRFFIQDNGFGQPRIWRFNPSR